RSGNRQPDAARPGNSAQPDSPCESQDAPFSPPGAGESSPMIEEQLEAHLIDFYHRQELSPQKLIALRALGEDRGRSHEKALLHPPALSNWRQVLVHGGVAGAVLGLLLGVFYLGTFPRSPLPGHLSADPLARSIGREIAMNHKKQLPMEFSAMDYAGLQSQM